MRKEQFMKRLKNRIGLATLFFIMFSIVTIAAVLSASAEGEWKKQGSGDNSQGDQKNSGKVETTGEVPVYGAIGNLDDKFSMDIDGDGTADLTIPEADLIEVKVSPFVAVNVHRQEANPGETETITSTSAEGVVENQNAYNKLKVSLAALEPQDEQAEKIKVTDELDQNIENGLSLSVYAKASDSGDNAFALPGDTLGTAPVSIANTAADPPVPVVLGTLSETEKAASSGTYLFQADCRSKFVDNYKDLPITFQAVYKFTIDHAN